MLLPWRTIPKKIALLGALLLADRVLFAPSLAFITRQSHATAHKTFAAVPTSSSSSSSSSSRLLAVAGESSRTVASCRLLGGELHKLSDELDGAPVFASTCTTETDNASEARRHTNDAMTTTNPTRLGLEGLIPGAFFLRSALSIDDCQAIIHSCESELKFSSVQDGDDIVQLLVSGHASHQLSRLVTPHVDLDVLFDLPRPIMEEKKADDDIRYTVAGISKYWRVHKYSRSSQSSGSVARVHVGQSPVRLSNDGSSVIFGTASKDQEIQSRFTVLVFLNDDFVGGQERFFRPPAEQGGQEMELVASIKPQTGSVLVFPQVANDNDSIHDAQSDWSLHASSPITRGSSRAKYVLRTDVLVATSHGLAEDDKGNPLFQYDALVRDAFLPRSPIVDKCFASQLASLYNPHMGVENAGPLLYSIVRFTKPRTLVEIGAGYTSLWLLQALKDNDNEMKRVAELEKVGKCRLLDYPWSIQENLDEYARKQSSLLCIDNCLHQRETATGAAAVAANLGLDQYFRFIQGDAYDMQFEEESIDLLWCDFGVGNRMRDFARGAWKSIRPGGFFVCHSTLTNKGTRDWLEDVRAQLDENVTGIPPQEVVELSLLEPTKRYQNSLTVLQRRRSSQRGEEYVEPLYSLYA